jgi:alkylhydroperoxidase family enzyme
VHAALAMLDPDRPRRPLAAAYTWSAFLLMLARDIPGAIEVGTRAVELTERLGEAPLLAQALNAVGSAQWFTEPERAEPTLLRSLEVARRAGDDGAAASALANLGSGAGEIRRYDVGERWLRECAIWCEQRDLDGHHRYALAWLARVFFERGRWTAAAEVLATAPPARMAPSQIVTLTALGRVRVRRGEPDAEADLARAGGPRTPARGAVQRRHRGPPAHRGQDRGPPRVGDPGQAGRTDPGGRGALDRRRGRERWGVAAAKVGGSKLLLVKCT